MMTRRTLLAFTGSAAAMLLLAAPSPARAQQVDAAASFVDQTGAALTGVVNGNDADQEKRAKLTQIIDRTVDVTDVARFCLGRFWRSASPAQQQDYLGLFHQVLVNNITGKIGEFRGVTFTMGRSAARDGDVAVSTVVTRPGQAPARVDWLVSTASGQPRIIDVIAEGTSLRLTQRQDYSSYLSRNGNNVQALIDAMRRQIAGGA